MLYAFHCVRRTFSHVIMRDDILEVRGVWIYKKGDRRKRKVSSSGD